MKNDNGDKYVGWKQFMWIVGLLISASIGLTILSGTFLFSRQEKQEDKIDILSANLTVVGNDVKWIKALFENQLDIQGMVDERVEKLVQKRFEIIPFKSYNNIVTSTFPTE